MTVPERLGGKLVWCPEEGFGWYPVKESDEPYRDGERAKAYFGKYVEYANTELGKALTDARVALVRRWTGAGTVARLLDVGIGSGAFLEAMRREGGLLPAAFGTDVNPVALAWLEERRLKFTPGTSIPDMHVTMWDVFEHLEDPWGFVAGMSPGAMLFVSMPVYDCGEAVLRSRHFRRDEHRWYWTAAGFCADAHRNGFALREFSDMESRLGRDSIGTFVLERLRA